MWLMLNVLQVMRNDGSFRSQGKGFGFRRMSPRRVEPEKNKRGAKFLLGITLCIETTDPDSIVKKGKGKG